MAVSLFSEHLSSLLPYSLLFLRFWVAELEFSDIARLGLGGAFFAGVSCNCAEAPVLTFTLFCPDGLVTTLMTMLRCTCASDGFMIRDIGVGISIFYGFT
jgi:hypothetical protein